MTLCCALVRRGVATCTAAHIQRRTFSASGFTTLLGWPWM
jgi:hypothetical protein